MEELVTSTQFAKSTGRAPRTVQGWVEDKDGVPRNHPGVLRIGKSFAATKETWEGIAATKGKQGRRDSGPRRKKDPGSSS